MPRGKGHPLSVSGTLETWLAPFDSAMRATLRLPVTRRIKVVRTTEWGNPAARSSSLPSTSLATGRRPLCRAGRPSRDLGFLLVSPLGNLALFPPLSPGRF